MPILIRRSNLIVPITDANAVSDAWRHNADAITLDLEDGVVDSRKAEARSLVKEALRPAGLGAAEVFVRVNLPFMEADIEASVWPGLTGIMLSQVESAAEVKEADALLTALERQHGLAAGSLQLILLLESGKGIWHVREIIHASPRVTQAGLDESDLAASIGILADPQYDPFVYARGRLAIEATAAQIQPIDVAYPMGTHPRLLPRDEILKAATDAKNLGFKGILCPHPSWVEPANVAFAPTESEINFYTQVREVFAQAIAAGTAAVPFAGRMIDVPVDEWAIVVLRRAAACAARDAEKKAALERAGVST